MSDDLPKAYYDGREARSTNQQKAAPSYLSTEGKHWWLAGWNDRDMELTQ